MSVKESIGTMLDQAVAGDKAGAEATFNEILASKVSSALENLKVDAADQMFNVQKESTELGEDKVVTDNGDGTETHVTKTGNSTSTVRVRKANNPMPAADLAKFKAARMSHGTHHGEKE